MQVNGFSEALAVPDLAQACFEVLDQNEVLPGAAIKKLRLVCKAVRDVMHTLVKSYTLQMEASNMADIQDIIKLLNGTRLLRLSILFPELSAAGNTRARHAASLKHSVRLSIFIAALGPTIGSVKRLHITLGSSTGYDTFETADTIAATALLLPLASACPLIERLAVTGRVGPSFLRTFGALCPQLSCLRASLTNLAPSTLKLLPTLLPHLTSLCVLPSRPFYHNLIRLLYEYDDRQPVDHVLSNAAACIALRSCHNLQHLDTTHYDMTEEVWAAMPLGLVSCTTAGAGHGHIAIPSPSPKWQQHVGLRRLGFTADAVYLLELTLLLAAAPHLDCVVLDTSTPQRVQADLSAGLEDNLIALDGRMQAGLTFATRETKSAGPDFTLTPSAMILLIAPTEGSSVSAFIPATLPPLPCFTNLRFYGRGNITTGDLSHLPHVFPNLQQVGFQSIDLGASALHTLASHHALTHLELRECGGVTRAELAKMCVLCQSLRQLSCDGCQDISVSDGRTMERKRWGRHGAVEVRVRRGAALEGEDERKKKSCLRARKR